MNTLTSRLTQLTASFAATFVTGSAIATLLGTSLGLMPRSRIDLWLFGILVATAVTSLLVLGGGVLASVRGGATVRNAWRVGALIAVPTVVGFEFVEFWSTFSGAAPWAVFVAIAAWCVGGPLYFMRANSAVESDAIVPALRASARAPHRER